MADIELELEIIDLTGELTESSNGDQDEDIDVEEPFEGFADEGAPVSPAQLRAAIFAWPAARLRTVLASLADTDPAVHRALARALVNVPHAARVRVVPRWETCAHCGETFDADADPEDAGEAACVFHPGELEADSASFAAWDEAGQGPIDSAYARREHPERFMWSCCAGDGVAEGCVRGVHVVADAHKKQRLSG
ncbi:hypothetical protein B0H10DRAFT_1852383 [Mycena sp. CBHHK59/15]|nr:hypothetical protein B0H10DRAFT_1852383 [Mycena sp. CBHHK59/15]